MDTPDRQDVTFRPGPPDETEGRKVPIYELTGKPITITATKLPDPLGLPELSALNPETGEHEPARFACGTWYTRRCTNPACGFENGVRIVGPDSPLGIDWPPGPCVLCDAATEWVAVGVES